MFLTRGGEIYVVDISNIYSAKFSNPTQVYRNTKKTKIKYQQQRCLNAQR